MYLFLSEENLRGILVGGSGPTKNFFVDEGYLHYEIQKKIIETFDTGYTDEYGLKELVGTAAETMTDLRISKEKKIMKRFLQEVTKSEKSLAVYGEKQVRRALEMGVMDTLLLSEDLRKYRVTLVCSSCNAEKKITIDQDSWEDFELPSCTKCNTSIPMEVKEKIDLIDEFSDIAEMTGVKVELISKNSEEGDSLLRAFDGVAGILRYSVEL